MLLSVLFTSFGYAQEMNCYTNLNQDMNCNTIDVQDEGVDDTSGGSAWYVGATMSF